MAEARLRRLAWLNAFVILKRVWMNMKIILLLSWTFSGIGTRLELSARSPGTKIRRPFKEPKICQVLLLCWVLPSMTLWCFVVEYANLLFNCFFVVYSPDLLPITLLMGFLGQLWVKSKLPRLLPMLTISFYYFPRVTKLMLEKAVTNYQVGKNRE